VKKLFALALCAMTVLSLSGCGAKPAETAGSPGAGIANPFVDYASLEEAVKDAGFPLTAPERIEGYDGPLVQLMSGKMLQLIFRSGDDRLIIRKAAGSEDISGDYRSGAEYAGRSVRINGADVTLKGADDKFCTAVWCANGYSYAVVSDTPLAADIMTDLIAEIA
jgi:hypothetical protein